MLSFLRSTFLLISLTGLCALSRAEANPDGRPDGSLDGLRAYACDPDRSHAEYHAVHPFAKVRGVNRSPVCTVWVTPDTAEFRIKVSLEVRGFKSGIKLRDSHAMKAVAADSFPKVVFTSASVKPSVARSLSDRYGPYTVTGDLVFHGLTRPVQATVTPEVKNGLIIVRGGFPISLAEFRARPPTLMGTTVKDKVEMTFEFVFTGSAPLSGAPPGALPPDRPVE